MKEYKIILTIRYSLYKPAYYFSEKVRNWDREPHQKETHSIEWVFIDSRIIFFSYLNLNYFLNTKIIIFKIVNFYKI